MFTKFEALALTWSVVVIMGCHVVALIRGWNRPPG